LILKKGTKGVADLVSHVWRHKESLRASESHRKEKLRELILAREISDKELNENIRYLGEIVVRDEYNNLMNEFDIKGNTCNLQSIIMNTYLTRCADKINENEILELSQLAMRLNQYEVFEELLKKVIETNSGFIW
jgi:hypothetical protein